MQADDPPYLSVGTAVSAKYKGAFCEAKVSKVVRIVKCKVTYKMGLGTATVSDEQIKGTLRVGHTVQAKHSERKEFVEATIGKIQDCSQYTVVFDDGDITTLRRSALCLKSGRHFNESETLDQLPLTHPEHFGNPVVGGRRGRRNRQLKDDSSEGEAEEENEPDLEGYSIDIGRVVSVEATDKKRSKDNWFPGLVVIPSAQPTVRINVKDEYLVRSFKDGRYYTVPKKEVSEFSREVGEKVESPVLAEAVNKALKYLDNNELPVHWERNSLFNMQSIDSDSDENYSDSSDDEPNEEKDRFVAQLYKFMDDSGTPLNKSPMIGNKDVDLHKLFRVVHKLGGYNRVTNKNKWRLVTTRLKLSNNQNTYNQVKNVYKKCLLSYESFYKTLGVTMLNHMSTKKNRGRSLIRDKDRATPINSPKLDKDEEMLEKKEDEKVTMEEKPKKKIDLKKDDEKRRKELTESSDTNSSDATDLSESLPSSSKESGRPRRLDRSKEKKTKPPVMEKLKTSEPLRKDEDEKTQQTRSKSQQNMKPKEAPINILSLKKDIKAVEIKAKELPKQTSKKSDDDKKRGRKKLNLEEKSSVEIVTDSLASQTVNIGDKLKVYYGPTHEYKVTYEAKVIDVDKDSTGLVYLVHYTGWNTRYDEWIAPSRIAENLSANTKAKRLKLSNSQSSCASKHSLMNKNATKRGRGTSVAGRSGTGEAPRSTTPSSVTSSSSRTKSPATPATRSTSRITRLDYGRKTRRASAQTDVSNHSDSDSDISESEAELTRTRSGNKLEEAEVVKTYKRKISRTPTATSKSEKPKDKEEADTEKEEESERPRRTRKFKKSSPEKSGEESDGETGSSLPKGRDFDLNQIRSELKGFNKAVKVPVDTTDKEMLSSSDDSNTQTSTSKSEPVDDKKEIKTLEASPTSDDIYEFKEPEPFEFETRPKLVDEKASKKRIPRLYEDLEKSPKKKTVKSPGKSDKDSPELEKKRFRRTPVRKQDESEDDEKKDEEDPFDKLVESPSFNLKPLEKAEIKMKPLRSSPPDDALNVFGDPIDEYSRDIDLSDTELPGQHLFTRDDELFSASFSKYSPETNLDLEFSTKVDDIKKENDDLASLRESITRAIERTPSSDECDNLSDEEELIITTSVATYQGKKRESEIIETSSTTEENVEVKSEVKEETPRQSPLMQISPALKETDSLLLESICTQPFSVATKLEETKDLSLKTGTKIADSLLQKFSSLKNKSESSPKGDFDKELDIKKDVHVDGDIDDNMKLTDLVRVIKPVELKVKPSEAEVKRTTTPTIVESSSTDSVKKRRKVVSRPYIEESDSNSNDSEQLIIARSDDDSQTNSLDKSDLKESDSNMSLAHLGITDDSLSQQEEQRNFKFDKIEKASSSEAVKEPDPETVKEDEPDSQLHSLLLCEETIPRSPAPASEVSGVVEQRPKPKSVLEMPFASAPGNCNNKNMLLNNEHKSASKPQPPPLIIPVGNRDNRDVSTVITPPSTPGSSTSGDHGDLSPNTIENESCKSNDAELDFPRKRRNSSLNKVPLYSEDDSQITNEPSAVKKSREESSLPATCRKRRKSSKGADEVASKRGRKPLNRSRHNSDSDDTSEHSLVGSATNLILSSFDRTSKSPRPLKYNFCVEFDPSLNSGQRIAVLQQKLSEIRKTYAEVKAELAAVERRRKKIRRREREALKASKQEMVCG